MAGSRNTNWPAGETPHGRLEKHHLAGWRNTTWPTKETPHDELKKHHIIS